ncbi:protein of unknown function [Methylacidimicrobium sp. AP8]|nr:protein of unknown function [Methylacidimicrobium sp. AP8]
MKRNLTIQNMRLAPIPFPMRHGRYASRSFGLPSFSC